LTTLFPEVHTKKTVGFFLLFAFFFFFFASSQHQLTQTMITPIAISMLLAAALAQSTTGTAPAATTAADTSGTAATGGTTAAATTAPTGTGAATTSVAGATTAAGTNAACTTDECCQKIQDGKQPCTTCTKTAGCVYFGLFNNNVFSAGGKCLISTTTEAPTGHKKIEKVTECADLCAGLPCDGCIGAKGVTGCVWCDTGKAIGDKVGVNTSTGSCELAKCNTGVTASTTCPSSASATAFSVAVAAVAAVFML
jgi:hypothetical protein